MTFIKMKSKQVLSFFIAVCFVFVVLLSPFGTRKAYSFDLVVVPSIMVILSILVSLGIIIELPAIVENIDLNAAANDFKRMGNSILNELGLESDYSLQVVDGKTYVPADLANSVADIANRTGMFEPKDYTTFKTEKFGEHPVLDYTNPDTVVPFGSERSPLTRSQSVLFGYTVDWYVVPNGGGVAHPSLICDGYYLSNLGVFWPASPPANSYVQYPCYVFMGSGIYKYAEIFSGYPSSVRLRDFTVVYAGSNLYHKVLYPSSVIYTFNSTTGSICPSGTRSNTGSLPSISADGKVTALPKAWAPGKEIPIAGVDSLPLTIPDDKSISGSIGMTQDEAQAGTVPKVDVDNPAKPDTETKIKKEDIEKLRLPTSIVDYFPFCIPFDVVKGFKLLLAPSKEPIIDIPFNIPGIPKQVIHIDLTEYEYLFVIVRCLITVLFVIGLASGTRKFIKW